MHSNYELLNVKSGKAEPFVSMRNAIDRADNRRLTSYRIVELRPDGSRITRISMRRFSQARSIHNLRVCLETTQVAGRQGFGAVQRAPKN